MVQKRKTPVERLKVGLQKFLDETNDPAVRRTTERLTKVLKGHEMAEQAKKRPSNYNRLSPREQWAVDKELGILDWDGK